MTPTTGRFLASALAEDNPFQTTAGAVDWLASASATNQLRVDLIPFAELGEWHFDPRSGDLVHRTGKFFRVEGLRVQTDLGAVSEWDQPIIDQPEVGILGLIARELHGQLCFLMQAKMEPGNPLGVQLTPTVQATRSNYTQVHQGARPRYVEYFLERRGRVLVDQLQFEHGSIFLRKRNRNIVVEVTEDVPVADGFCWLTLGQIKKLLLLPNLVGMDTRSVVSCIALVERSRPGDEPPAQRDGASPFGQLVLGSLGEVGAAVHSDEEVLSWLTDLKCRHSVDLQRIGLQSVRGWHKGDQEMVHEGYRYFRVLAADVEAGNREVSRWAQPLVGSTETGLIGFLTREVHGVLHVLVQGRIDPGNFDGVAVGPSVQCALGYERLGESGRWPPFTDLLVNAPSGSVRYACLQSEEGGRFYHVENEYKIVELDETTALDLPPNNLWNTLRQLQELLRFGLVNIEARNVLACLPLT